MVEIDFVKIINLYKYYVMQYIGVIIWKLNNNNNNTNIINIEMCY